MDKVSNTMNAAAGRRAFYGLVQSFELGYAFKARDLFIHFLES